MLEESPRSIAINVLKIRQPIGEIYVGAIDAAQLYEIANFDVRHIEQHDGIDKYLGIQRELNGQRVKSIRQYVTGLDASFPTSVVLAVDEKNVAFEQPCEDVPELLRMTLSNFSTDETGQPSQVSLYRSIARVIDGQHRIAGLEGYDGVPFQLNVSLFVGADIADQAAVFSAVNLTQTKVNRSLAYDLYELSESPSPERTAHNVAVSLDRIEGSPLQKRIMRLGKATPGRTQETLSQAVVVNAILDYISGSQAQVLIDRQYGRKGKEWPLTSKADFDDLIFRKMFVENRGTDISLTLINYFNAVRKKWQPAWDELTPGLMLNRANGFAGLMKFLRPAYNSFRKPGATVSETDFYSIFEPMDLKYSDFSVTEFLPGSSGASFLYRTLLSKANF